MKRETTKKAVLWMIAAMMILGSLKSFASDDVTAGKLDAVAQDSLENDIHADITEGKIQAAMLESTLQDIQLQIIQIDRLQDEVGAITRESSEDSMNASSQMIKKLGWEAALQTQRLESIARSLDLREAAQMKKDMEALLETLTKEVEEEVRNLSR